MADHEHFISSRLIAIARLALLASGWTMVQRQVRNLSDGLRTISVFSSGLQNLSYGHPDLLLYQAV